MRHALIVTLTAVLAAGCAATRPPDVDPADLVKELRSPDDDRSRRLGIYATLAEIGPGAAEAVPTLVDRLLHGDDHDRFGSLIALRGIGPAARDAVPALIEILEHDRGYPPLRTYAAEALGAVGPDAHAAVPALAEGLRVEDRSATFEPAAKDALRRILEL